MRIIYSPALLTDHLNVLMIERFADVSRVYIDHFLVESKTAFHFFFTKFQRFYLRKSHALFLVRLAVREE